MEFDDIASRAIGCALEVHRELGPGLFESTDLHEARWRQDRTADQLQRYEAEDGHQAFRSLTPSCSSCPSW